MIDFNIFNLKNVRRITSRSYNNRFFNMFNENFYFSKLFLEKPSVLFQFFENTRYL